uniref:Uncharacterized protein n=1 Tax=Opuntia streptacantha TaxID=393608 RepID=A0A7C9DMC7_OPUST
MFCTKIRPPTQKPKTSTIEKHVYSSLTKTYEKMINYRNARAYGRDLKRKKKEDKEYAWQAAHYIDSQEERDHPTEAIGCYHSRQSFLFKMLSYKHYNLRREG